MTCGRCQSEMVLSMNQHWISCPQCRTTNLAPRYNFNRLDEAIGLFVAYELGRNAGARTPDEELP